MHDVGRRTEIEPFLEQVRDLFKLKASDLILEGKVNGNNRYLNEHMHRLVHPEPRVVRLEGSSDKDLAQDCLKRKSVTCLHVVADAYWVSSVGHSLVNLNNRWQKAWRAELWSDTESVQIAVSNNNPQSLEVRSTPKDGGGLVSLRATCESSGGCALEGETGGTGSLRNAQRMSCVPGGICYRLVLSPIGPLRSTPDNV